MKYGVLMCDRCPVIHVEFYPVPCNTDYVYLFKQTLGGCLWFMFSNNFRRSINITKGKTTQCDKEGLRAREKCSVAQFFLRFPAAKYKVSKLYSLHKIELYYISVHTTLHHFLSISLDEQQSTMSHILL